MEHNFSDFIRDKNVLVTGGTGSIGRVLVAELMGYNPRVVRVLSRDAVKQSELQSELGHPRNVRFILGDVKDPDRVLMACEDVQVIFHAAAFKHVPQGEYNPFEVIQTNVLGTQNLLSAALKTPSVTHFVMISTDKAVQPMSVMGASKFLAERLVSATHYMKGKKEKVFTTVRFGNVLGTSGSVINAFREQAKKGEITVTHPEMVRFFMTVPDAVRLVCDAVSIAHGGEVFVLKMPALAIKDLAQVCSQRFSGGKATVGFGSIRAGEKLHEALLSQEEARSALETDHLFIIVPQVETNDIYRKDYDNAYPGATKLISDDGKNVSYLYETRSAPRMSIGSIEQMLERANIV